MGRALWTLAVATVGAVPAPAADRILRTELTIEAPVAEVWRAWTTEPGIRSFFGKDGRVEPRVDGLYEVYFDPTAEPGRRGAEGLRILAFEPEERLAFTWNAPPDQPYARAQRTQVVVELAEAGPQRTRLRFTHLGWGDGPEWDRAYDYFDAAWNTVVLPRLVHRFRSGPLNWDAPPRLEPVARTLKTELVPKPAGR